jgi:hypothetical protein
MTAALAPRSAHALRGISPKVRDFNRAVQHAWDLYNATLARAEADLGQRLKSAAEEFTKEEQTAQAPVSVEPSRADTFSA